MPRSGKSNTALNAPNYVNIGKILGAHGVRGLCRALSYADSDAIFSSGRTFYFRGPGQRMIPFEILEADRQPRRLLLRIRGVGDRDAAEKLAGSEIWVKKSDLPPPEEGAYYWFDLIGLTVVTTRGEILGTLAHILPTGGNDVYVVQDANGRETLIPALADVVLEVDLQRNQMVVDLPEGL